jgi:hypothetical protein
MLTKGLRDEENERINNILKKLMELVYIPENLKPVAADALLAQLGLSAESLAGMSAEALTQHLGKMHFDWANMELLADVLAAWPQKAFTDKAMAVYSYVQHESKMFSLDIFNKINTLTK